MFTTLLDEYLDAKAALTEAKLRNPESGYYGQYTAAHFYAVEQAEYVRTEKALNDFVERLLAVEASVRTRDIVQPLPGGFP